MLNRSIRTELKAKFFSYMMGNNSVSDKTEETHQEMRYSNVTSLYFATPVAFNARDGGVP